VFWLSSMLGCAVFDFVYEESSGELVFVLPVFGG